MRKKISAKILVLVGVLFAAGAAGIIMGMILINSMNDRNASKSEKEQLLELLELYNNTVISVDKNSNAQYAKIFVWINDMQPITNSEEISLIN